MYYQTFLIYQDRLKKKCMLYITEYTNNYWSYFLLSCLLSLSVCAPHNRKRKHSVSPIARISPMMMLIHWDSSLLRLDIQLVSILAVRSTAQEGLRDIDFLFFTQALVSEVCQFTNSQGWGLIFECPLYGDCLRAWLEVTPTEFHRFLGLLIYMGFAALPDLHR